MATQTIYLLNTAATAPNWFGRVQDNGSAPAGALSAFGWTVAKVAITTEFWRARIGATARATVVQTNSYIDSATGPTQGTGAGATTAGDLFRSDNPLNGTFAAGNWNFTFGMRTGAATNSGRMRCLMWASTNADGTSARKLTSATLVGTTVLMNSATATFNSTVTWAAPQVVLNNEYLFLQVEWESTVAGTSNSCTAQFYQCSFVTTNYVYAIPAISGAAGSPVFGTPLLTPNIDVLDANDIAAGAPDPGDGILGQKHVLGTSAPTVAGSPVFGDLVFGQTSPIDNIPNAIAAVAGLPTLDAPVMAQIPNFVAPNFAVATLALSAGTLGQKHVLAAPLTAQAGLPFIPAPVLTQSNILTAITAAAGVFTYTAPDISQRVALLASVFTTAAPAFSAPTIVSGLQDLLLDGYVIDNGLAALASADQMLLCTTQPVSYANAVATRLATKTLGSGNVFGPPAAAADGRKCTSAPISGGTVNVNGDAICWVAVNAAGTQLLASGLIDTTPVAIGQAWAMTPVAVHLPSGA